MSNICTQSFPPPYPKEAYMGLHVLVLIYGFTSVGLLVICDALGL
jgi:hypothetical protein